MLVSKNAQICVTPNAYFKICVTPNAKPQRESVEYRLRWVPNAKFSRWPCTFHVVCAHFIRFGDPTRTQFAVEYGRVALLKTVSRQPSQCLELWKNKFFPCIISKGILALAKCKHSIGSNNDPWIYIDTV